MPFTLKPFVELADAQGIELIGVNVRQHDQMIGDYLWRTNDRLDMKSCSKGVTCLAVGIAKAEGLIDLEERVVDCFAEELRETPLPGWCDVTVKNLLTMTTGHEHNVIVPSRFEAAGKDWLGYIFSQEPAEQPGTRFIYNNAAPYLCGRIIEKRSGQCLRDYLLPRLFEPMDIFYPQWFTCPQGHTRCMGGLFLNRFELAKIGQLCLNGGSWQGKQLVERTWIEEASRAHVVQHACVDDVQKEPEKDFAAGYGYFWWRNSVEGYRFNGRYGQFCLILPGHDAVVATTGIEQRNEQGILDAVWQTILPQL